MARRSTTQQASVEETVDQPVEELDTETLEEAVEATTEEPTEEPTEAPAEVDLTPFKDAANSALEEADRSTGDLPKTSIDAVNKVYREIDGIKGKNAARAWLDDEMKAAIVGKDIMRAKAFVMLKDGLSAGGGSATPKAPADPTAAFVQKVVALQLALNEVVGNVPEGVSDDWTEKATELESSLADDVEKYRAYTQADADAEQPEVSPVVRQAFKLAAGRGSSSGSSRVAGGPRRDIEKHLVQVFDDLESGSFLTINEIAKSASTEYGDDRPSAGAVSARLFPRGRDPYEANGIKASAEEGKPRGAVKL